MQRKHIDIQGININFGPWIHTRPAKNFTFMEANGVTFAVTENNYYLDTKVNKIRYHFMDTKGASWDHSYAVYMEVYPGIFAYCIQCTEFDLTNRLNQFAAIYHKNDYANNPAVDEWRKGLKRVE